MKNLLVFLILFISIFINNTVNALDKPNLITLAHEDKNAYPWILPHNGSYVGLDKDFIEILSKKLNTKIVLKAFPWQRCLELMKINNVNGAFAASYKKRREEYGKYPTMKNNKPNKSLRIHTSGYSLYMHKSLNIKFDGKKFSNITSEIGVQKGFSIVDPLKKFNANLYIVVNADPNSILKLINALRINAGALQTARADYIINNNPEFKKSIAKYKTNKKPFHQKEYYIMLSHQFVEKYPEFAKKFWNTCKSVRNSKEFKNRVKSFYSKNY